MALDAERLQAISQRIAAHIRRTPLICAPSGGYLKLESLQPTGSFKVRGFFAAALTLEPGQLSRGLMTVSAGNAPVVEEFLRDLQASVAEVGVLQTGDRTTNYATLE